MLLAEIIAKIDGLIEGLEDREDSPLPAELDRLLEAKADKIDGYALAITHYTTEIEGTEAKLKLLTERYKTELERLKNKRKALEDRLLSLYQQGLLKDKNKGNHFAVNFRNYPVCELSCKVEELPDEFKRVKVEPKLNEIKKAIKDDPSLGIAELVDNYKVQVK